MMTQPLDLQSRLSREPRDLDCFAWVNVGLIVLFFGLLGSRFVLVPGVPIGIDGETDLVLPTVGGPMQNAAPASVVVSCRRDNVILFEGGMYSLADLRRHMQSYVQKNPGAVMLVRIDRQVTTQALLDLCEMAREVGFANVVVAAEQPVETTP